MTLKGQERMESREHMEWGDEDHNVGERMVGGVAEGEGGRQQVFFIPFLEFLEKLPSGAKCCDL